MQRRKGFLMGEGLAAMLEDKFFEVPPQSEAQQRS